MKFTFVRHGFAHHNQGFLEEGEIAYRSDKYRNSYLTEKGHDQVRETKIPEVDLVFSSPLTRCIQTTRVLVGDDPTIYLCDGLIETQGPYPCNCRETIHEISAKYKNINSEFLSDQYSPSAEEETMNEMKGRAYDSLNIIKEYSKLKGARSILIVTHCDWLEAMFDRKFKNAEAFTVDLD